MINFYLNAYNNQNSYKQKSYNIIIKMLKNELKILNILIGDMITKFTINHISKILKQKYFQTYRTTKGLEKMDLINIQTVGKSNVIELDFTKYHQEYVVTEIERCKEVCKNKKISIIFDNILKVNKQFICILFGSYSTNKHKSGSDIDLLFVIPEEYDYGNFERMVKRQLSLYDCDINITTEKGLLDMWSNPKKLNVGNELLKNHVVLQGAESFINLLRRYYVG